MAKRPLSVTIVAVLIALAAAFGAAHTIINKDVLTSQGLAGDRPLPVSFLLGITYLGFAIQAISAIGILNKKNWARLLLAFWIPTSLVIVAVISTRYRPGFATTALVGPFIIYLVLMFFLFRPVASQYFQNRNL